jgi:nucleoside-diphosphate-sugar epimerase
MAGMKFGATGQSALTWAMNVLVPANVCRRYRGSKIVAFSTGNVYGLTSANGPGSREEDALRPIGEYAMTTVGRERMFEHFSGQFSIPTVILRLYYATEMRYGVLVDIARTVWAGEPVPLAMGYLNSLWQGDANAMSLAAFDHLASPPTVLNLAGPQALSVRRVAENFGRLLGKPVRFEGTEAPDALLANTDRGKKLFGPPRVSVDQMIAWIADWVRKGGADLGKPTHFENRAGNF